MSSPLSSPGTPVNSKPVAVVTDERQAEFIRCLEEGFTYLATLSRESPSEWTAAIRML